MREYFSQIVSRLSLLYSKERPVAKMIVGHVEFFYWSERELKILVGKKQLVPFVQPSEREIEREE